MPQDCRKVKGEPVGGASHMLAVRSPPKLSHKHTHSWATAACTMHVTPFAATPAAHQNLQSCKHWLLVLKQAQGRTHSSTLSAICSTRSAAASASAMTSSAAFACGWLYTLS